MLRLYSGRENIDKERFIYENITGETLVIVPNQYTLAAEEQALRYMGSDCLFSTEILSMNRLGLRVLTEKGTESVRMLDKYGRFMLLSKLIREHRDDFDIFRRAAGRQSFTSMLNDFISEFKQQDCTLDQITEMADGEDADPLLRAKLAELKGVVAAYEEAISGRYTDSEDYISMYITAIGDSVHLKGKTIWIYGYDSITPKFARAVIELAKVTRSVNFIINESDFALDRQMRGLLVRMGEAEGVDVDSEEIGSEYISPKSETIERIERGLWNMSPGAGEREANRNYVPEDLVLVGAANPYYEAESAASYVWHLVRDEGYRLSDIQIIANDEGTMQPIIRRVFEEYGLPVFMDSVRNITDTAAVGFIVNLLWFVVHRRTSRYLFAMLKTGLSGVDMSVTEDLENYVRDYHIRGTMWDKNFKYGADNLGEEKFAALNDARNFIMTKVRILDEIVKHGAEGARTDGAAANGQELAPGDGDAAPKSAGGARLTVSEFVPAFKAYLRDVWHLDEAAAAAAAEEEAAGMNDEAQRNIQSLRKAIEILDQISEIMGDSAMDLAEFTDIYTAGLANVEVGVIPPAVDGLSMGTMIRTRPRPVRAAVILGANEGVLPLSPSPEGLFSVDEKEFFRQKGFALGSLDDIKMKEEQAAMYRMLSKPSSRLYISWSLTDASGSDASPSELIESLMALFPMIRERGLIHKDIVSAGWDSGALNGDSRLGDIISMPDESLRYLIARVKDRNAPETADAQMRALYRWFRDERPEQLSAMVRAAQDMNDQKPLGRELARSLFGRTDGSLVLSASSLSGYFDCPFKYFVDRGLRPREEREFTGDSRSVGDAYHECLMVVARKIIADRELLEAVIDNDEALERLVSDALEEIAGEYRGGLFISTGSEEYRMSRIREICAGAARAMARQLSAESVIDAAFEEGFGRSRKFEPVTIDVGGEKVYVEGKIDRSDILDVDGSRRVRIIDYKTGSDSLDLWKMRHGYRMQLMIYMISASSGEYEPAGMFYFNIKDPIESLDSKDAGKEDEITSREPEDIFKLKGRYINEPGVLESMPEEVLAGKTDKSRAMSREEFEEVRAEVLSSIEKTAANILDGVIDIDPFKDDGRLVCSRCGYKAVCRRDRGYPDRSGREIPSKKDEVVPFMRF